MLLNDVKLLIRDVPDFPEKGIVFKDITPVLQSPEAFRSVVDLLCEPYQGVKVDSIAGIESRGFIFGAAMAMKLGCTFVPIRKKGKLPYSTLEESYSLEYGRATLEIHTDAVKKKEKVVVVDDLLATGGTACASANLLKKLDAEIVGISFMIELAFLGGKEKLKGYEINSLIKVD